MVVVEDVRVREMRGVMGVRDFWRCMLLVEGLGCGYTRGLSVVFAVAGRIVFISDLSSCRCSVSPHCWDDVGYEAIYMIL